MQLVLMTFTSVQRFIRKRCAGRQIGKGIFFPQELVTQERTKMLAICKQGYLNRYGLLIQLHPEVNLMMEIFCLFIV